MATLPPDCAEPHQPANNQHFIPATFLAGFSTDDFSPRRRRRVWVADRDARVFRTKAEQVGVAAGFYGEDDSRFWRYEAALANAILVLEDDSHQLIDFSVWARTLVPFVTALFARGPDFDERMSLRLGPLGAEVQPWNTNGARHIEIQRTLAPVLGARWIVLHARAGAPFITSDVGWTPFLETGSGEIGTALPLTPRTILGIVPLRWRLIAQRVSGQWKAPVEHYRLAAAAETEFNGKISACARREVYGASRAVVESATSPWPPASEFPLEPTGFEIYSRQRRVALEFEWHRLVSSVEGPSLGGDIGTDARINWSVVARGGYAPAVVVPINVPSFPSAFRFLGDEIVFEGWEVDEASPTGWALARLPDYAVEEAVSSGATCGSFRTYPRIA